MTYESAFLEGLRPRTQLPVLYTQGIGLKCRVGPASPRLIAKWPPEKYPRGKLKIKGAPTKTTVLVSS